MQGDRKIGSLAGDMSLYLAPAAAVEAGSVGSMRRERGGGGRRGGQKGH